MMCIGWKSSGCKKIPLNGGYGCNVQGWFWIALIAAAVMGSNKGKSKSERTA